MWFYLNNRFWVEEFLLCLVSALSILFPNTPTSNSEFSAISVTPSNILIEWFWMEESTSEGSKVPNSANITSPCMTCGSVTQPPIGYKGTNDIIPHLPGKVASLLDSPSNSHLRVTLAKYPPTLDRLNWWPKRYYRNMWLPVLGDERHCCSALLSLGLLALGEVRHCIMRTPKQP